MKNFKAYIIVKRLFRKTITREAIESVDYKIENGIFIGLKKGVYYIEFEVDYNKNEIDFNAGLIGNKTT